MQKARTLDCDVVIFDLEDAVSPAAKESARSKVFQSVIDGGYGHRELVVRVNSLSSEWGLGDVERFVSSPISAMLFPKIENTDQLDEIDEVLSSLGGSELPRWLMIETPRGVLNLEALAGCFSVGALVMGTSDLVKELRAAHTQSRENISYALQRSVMIARANSLEIFDGVHLEFKNLKEFRDSCEGGSNMGFDGKTLIHPDQIEITNEVFGVTLEDYDLARRVLAEWEKAEEEGKGVAVLDGQLIESLHAEQSRRLVSLYQEINKRGPDDLL
jgi:citrate lyase subunit beta/citryl-CoA lyase